jgi:hypothetical protein
MSVNAEFVENQPTSPIISLRYLMNSARNPGAGGDDELRIAIYHHDCAGSAVSNAILNPVSIDPVNVNTPQNTRAWDLNVVLNTQNVFQDADLVVGSPSDFTIRMCVRTTMINLPTQGSGLVGYDETNVEVKVQLTGNVGPLFIAAVADDRRDVSDSEAVIYPVTACLCNDANNCVNEPRHPNQDIRVCIISANSLVETLDVRDMELTQNGNFLTKVVENRASTVVLAVEKFQVQTTGNVGEITVVQFPALPVFFQEQSNPEAIRISGTALMQFRSRRNLKRHLEDDPDIVGEGEFAMSITMDPAPAADSAASKMMSAVAACLVLVGAMLMV